MLPPAAPVAPSFAATHIKHSPTQITSESPASPFSSDCFLLFACFQFFWVEKSESGLKSEEKKWKWIEICVRRWVRHVFSLGCSHRRQNGTILGKFRWKTKTSCFDAKLVLTQPAVRQFKSAGAGCDVENKVFCPKRSAAAAESGGQFWAAVLTKRFNQSQF